MIIFQSAHISTSTDSLLPPLTVTLPLPLPSDEVLLDYDMGPEQALTDAIATNLMLFKKWVRLSDRLQYLIVLYVHAEFALSDSFYSL